MKKYLKCQKFQEKFLVKSIAKNVDYWYYLKGIKGLKIKNKINVEKSRKEDKNDRI